VTTPPPSPEGRPAAADSNQVTFDRLYAAHFERIYTYVARRRPAHEVPDLVAEVFATTWRRIEVVPPPPEDRLWLYGVAGKILSHDERTTHRRRALLGRLVQTHSSSSGQADTDVSASVERLRDLIAHLKPLDREVVRLVAWDALTHDEVAQVLGCSANAVAIRWHRSLARLRSGLTPLTTQRDVAAFPRPQKETNSGD
jgi:RNA polymerase sigma-70 factor (ECF subfamily)